jgi:hypothetical protein
MKRVQWRATTVWELRMLAYSNVDIIVSLMSALDG